MSVVRNVPVSTQITVGTAGTRVALSNTSIAVSTLIIEALETNTNRSACGGPTTKATSGTAFRGVSLDSRDSFTYQSEENPTNLSDWYLDVRTSGEGFAVTYIPV